VRVSSPVGTTDRGPGADSPATRQPSRAPRLLLQNAAQLPRIITATFAIPAPPHDNVDVPDVTIYQALPAQIPQVRELFLEYAASLGFSLCFQNFDQELAALPGDYAPPKGRLLLAEYESQLAGCIALHQLDLAICEMKRLYLRPNFRGKGIGRKLAENLITEARQIGYRIMRLDTVEPVMKDAIVMYRKLEFHEVPPYRPNPIPGALYMEKNLQA